MSLMSLNGSPEHGLMFSSLAGRYFDHPKGNLRGHEILYRMEKKTKHISAIQNDVSCNIGFLH